MASHKLITLNSTYNSAAENSIGRSSIATLLSGDQQFGKVTMSPSQNSRKLSINKNDKNNSPTCIWFITNQFDEKI